MRRVYLMSFKPLFAFQVVRGEKGYELRRRASIEEGARILVYASSPVKAIVGEFKAGRVKRASPGEVEEFVLSGALKGCDERDLPYVRGKSWVAIIEVTSPIKYTSHLSLERIREIAPWFRPPISFYELKPLEKWKWLLKEVEKLLK